MQRAHCTLGTYMYILLQTSLFRAVDHASKDSRVQARVQYITAVPSVPLSSCRHFMTSYMLRIDGNVPQDNR